MVRLRLVTLTYDKILGQTPFVVYYSKVTLEVSKLIFQGQKMSPP